ncbi:hypothetical protein [Crateriforma conspicua]|uniref:Flagellar motor switch protein FliG n=1 Tax=Crateriforma conspicua TaxID=2527996 RepID=A0A5C6FRB5_9PLAN|nr:hypothetical protein [Crateriforma conspicua]TWU64786.1 Flagellar motor switch protein FliG [Crateriforma conspicua]
MNAGRQAAQNREVSLRRVAIVMSSLPGPLANRLMSQMSDTQRTQLRRTMTGLADVDPMERKRALQAFSGSIQNRVDAPIVDDEFQVSTTGSVGPVTAASQATPKRNHPLGFLDSVPDGELTRILESEHPQIAAIVLASIEPEKAAKLLSRLDSSSRRDVVRRIGRLESIEPETLNEVSEMLRAKCLDIELPAQSSGGASALRQIMARMPMPGDDPATSRSRIDSPDASTPAVPPSQPKPSSSTTAPSTNGTPMKIPLSGKQVDAPESSAGGKPVDDAMTQQIHQMLERSSPGALCQALGKVETRDALLTLCGISRKQADRAIAMLPKAAQKETRRALANLGPLKISDIDQAKQRVAAQMPTAVAAAA